MYRRAYTLATHVCKYWGAFIFFHRNCCSCHNEIFFFSSFIKHFCLFLLLKSYYQMCRVRVYIFIRIYTRKGGGIGIEKENKSAGILKRDRKFPTSFFPTSPFLISFWLVKAFYTHTDIENQLSFPHAPSLFSVTAWRSHFILFISFLFIIIRRRRPLLRSFCLCNQPRHTHTHTDSLYAQWKGHSRERIFDFRLISNRVAFWIKKKEKKDEENEQNSSFLFPPSFAYIASPPTPILFLHFIFVYLETQHPWSISIYNPLHIIVLIYNNILFFFFFFFLSFSLLVCSNYSYE